jgi:adenylate cyclase
MLAAPVTRTATVMFTDIVGSTRIQEEVGARWSTIFGQHLGLLHECIEREGGTVFEQTGDGVLAVFGFPKPLASDADAAVRAALAIGRGLDVVQVPGTRAVRVRVGIHTGAVEIGAIGSPGRGHYGVRGQTVSLTQRVEQAGKSLCPDAPGAAVLISDVTRQALRGDYALVDLGRHELRGATPFHRLWRVTVRDADTVAEVEARQAAKRPLPHHD